MTLHTAAFTADFAANFSADFTREQAAYRAALDRAHARALHSYFDQHIIIDRSAGYVALDEGDYGVLAPELAERVVETVRGQLSDEF